MSEYSNEARYYCKVCNLWIANNQPSRQHHESSNKHKFKILEQQKKLKIDKLNSVREENELKKQLAELDRLANDAIHQDRRLNLFQGVPNHSSSVIGAVPITTTSNKISKAFTQQSKPTSSSMEYKSGYHNRQQEKETLENGYYIVQGKGYLEGPFNVDYLKRGITCQIFNEELDDWYNVIVINRIEVPIPHTALMMKEFDVEYLQPESHQKQIQTGTREYKVKTDRLRLFANDEKLPINIDGSKIYIYNWSEEQILATKKIVPKVKEEPLVIDEHTGIGQWQTVAINVVDEEEMQRLEEEEEKQENDKIEFDSKLLGRPKKDNLEAEKLLMSTRNVVDPYNKNVYKGYVIGKAVLEDFTNSNLSNGNVVDFKRKVSDEAKDPNVVVKKSRGNIRKSFSNDD